MGYVPLFDTLITGTLHGKWPDIGLWPVILSMADRFGNVDVTPEFISGVTGLPVDEVESCIKRFCEPDPRSRSDIQEGRRLEPLPDRKWGWHVVNHASYREKARLLARDSERTASGMDAKRKRESREAPRSPPKSPEVPPSDGDVNGDADGNGFRSSPSPTLVGSSSPLRSSPDSDGLRSETKRKIGGIAKELAAKHRL